MLTIDPKSIDRGDMHQYLLGSVAPRPICFASTMDENGNPNLAPYSFFNAFSSNPPTVVFSSNRRGSNSTTKDTLHNVQATGEVVINVVNYKIVRQMALTSVEYPNDVSEFEKAGLTPLRSELVQPFRVAESPVQMECKVRQIITLATTPGAGHLIICDILRMHINEAVLDKNGKIDPHKIDLMGRMGRAYYCRASGSAIHKIFQPILPVAIGVDSLPESVQLSEILTGNDLGKLGSLLALPSPEALAKAKAIPAVNTILTTYKDHASRRNILLHQFAKSLLGKGEIDLALAVLWLA